MFRAIISIKNVQRAFLGISLQSPLRSARFDLFLISRRLDWIFSRLRQRIHTAFLSRVETQLENQFVDYKFTRDLSLGIFCILMSIQYLRNPHNADETNETGKRFTSNRAFITRMEQCFKATRESNSYLVSMGTVLARRANKANDADASMRVHR